MIEGRITADGWPQVELVIFDAGGSRQTITVLVDTGYDGYLVLPPSTVRELDLADAGEASNVTIASGDSEDRPVYRANVLWNGQTRAVEALESDSPPLLGMAMIYDPDAGHADRLTIDAARLTVLIEHNPPPSFTEDLR